MVTFAIMTEDAMRVQGPPQGQWTREDWEKQDHEAGIRYELMLRAVVKFLPQPRGLTPLLVQESA
jgi:hypothetical protein